jgi:Protein of unknwon function (DUF3310)
MNDAVHHPTHYNQIDGIECIEVVEILPPLLANCAKYVWRAGYKDHAKEREDLQKARWYLSRAMAGPRVALHVPSGAYENVFDRVFRLLPDCTLRATILALLKGRYGDKRALCDALNMINGMIQGCPAKIEDE